MKICPAVNQGFQIFAATFLLDLTTGKQVWSEELEVVKKNLVCRLNISVFIHILWHFINQFFKVLSILSIE